MYFIEQFSTELARDEKETLELWPAADYLKDKSAHLIRNVNWKGGGPLVDRND